MATKSLADLQAQIERLQAEAAKLRDEERAGVVARIREAISTYDLTAEDLFGSASRSRAAQRGRTRGTRHGSPAYGDGTGNVWGGRGPRPKWLRDALAQGKQLEDFALDGRRSSGPVSATPQEQEEQESPGSKTRRRQASEPSRRKGSAKRSGRKPSIKYRDDAGNAWSGLGPQPKWFKDALASGTSLEALQAQT